MRTQPPIGSGTAMTSVASRIDRDQLQPVKPDGERALADSLEQELSDLRPGRMIFRPRRPELEAHLGEVDRDQPRRLRPRSVR